MPSYSILFAVLLILVTTQPAEAKSTFVYVHDRGTPSQIHGFELKKSGKLTPISGSPFPTGDDGSGCGGPCQTLSYSNGHHAIFASGPSGISVFSVKKSGELHSVVGSPFGPRGPYLGTAVFETSKQTYVYAAQPDADSVRAFRVGEDLTLEDLLSPAATGDAPDGISLRGKRLVVCNEGSQTVSSFLVGKDGSLTVGGVVNPVASFIYTVEMNHTGDFAYQTDSVGTLVGYAVDPNTAALSVIAGFPLASGLASGNGGVATSKKFLIAFRFAGQGVDDIALFKPKKDGSLKPLATQSSGLPFIAAHAISADSRFLVVASDQSNALVSFSLNKKTGEMDVVDMETLEASQVSAVILVDR